MIEASALCAIHPDTRAVFICERCGSFGCEACRRTPSSAFCRTCQAPLPAVLFGRLALVSLLRDTLPQRRRNLRALGLLAPVWVLALPGAMIDRGSAMTSLGRIWGLSKGHRWGLLALFLCYFLLRWVRMTVMMPDPSLLRASPGLYALTELATTLVGVTWRVIFLSALVLFYLRRTQGAGHAAVAVEAVPGADGR